MKVLGRLSPAAHGGEGPADIVQLYRPSECVPVLGAQFQALPIAGKGFVQLAAHPVDPGELVQRGLFSVAEARLPAYLQELLETLDSAVELPALLVNQADQVQRDRAQAPVGIGG